MSWSRRFGPGLLVTAAFIGPGTVTTATRAGATFGLSLLWVLLFAVIAAVVLQEMSARLGLVTREGLGEALRSSFVHPLTRLPCILLVVAAITVGNAAFQTGNITGAAMGLSALTPVSRSTWSVVIGVAAGASLFGGNYRRIERLLILLVAVMSLVFLVTAVMVKPTFHSMIRGAVPSLPPGSGTTIIALIGTTVVPYNLFLHACVVREKWPASRPVDRVLTESRIDTITAVTLGGFVTLAIVATAAAFFDRGAPIRNAADMASQLEPLLGSLAKVFFALGLVAAGLTSAITAPLAAAYATAGALGWTADLKSWKFRAVWMLVVLIGTVFAAAGHRPVRAILLAQAANGLILPVIAVFLLIAVNRKRLMGRHANGLAANVLGSLVVLVALGLGTYKVIQVLPPPS